MAKHDQDLAQAERLFKKRQFAEAGESYTKVLFRTGDNGPIYTRLGLCHLYSTDLGKAEYFFDKALALDPYNKVALMTAAYLDLLADRESAALHKYTQLLQLRYEKKNIRRILDALRQAGKARDFAALQPADFFLQGKGFPSASVFGRLKNGKMKWWLGAALLGVLCFLAIWQFGVFSKLSDLVTGGEDKSGLLLGLYENLKPAVEKKPGDNPLEKIYLYDLSNSDKTYRPGELLATFEEVKKDIAARRINRATIKINRVLLSDANLLIKEKFRLLEGMIPPPNFSDFKNDQLMRDLTRDRAFEKVYVKHRGSVGSIRSRTNQIIFDFTFIEENETWTTEVRLEKSPGLRMEAGKEYVILAQYRGFDGGKRKPVLEARVIKQFVTGAGR